jgi:2-dehydro-3-deoxygluconokinase
MLCLQGYPMIDVLCLGEPLLEFNAQEQGQYFRSIGGDVSNVAVAVARQKSQAGMLTRMGQDSFAEEILQLWEREGIDTSRIIRDEEAPTGIYFISHGPSGHVFDYRRVGSASSRLKPSDIKKEHLLNVKILHLSGISLAISDNACEASLRAIELAKENGVKISFDPNLRLKLWSLSRAKAIIQHVASLADFVLPGLDDARQLTGLENPESIVDEYLKMGVEVVALTLGDQGVLLATQDSMREQIPGIPAKLVDATAAGDCFDGGFLTEWLRTKDLLQAARYGNVAASLSVQHFGAVASLPSREKTELSLSSE